MKHVLIILGLAILVLLFVLVRLPCKACKGSGVRTAQVTEVEPCPYCQGRGKIDPELARPSGVKSTFTQTRATCPRCQGSGHMEDSGLQRGPCRPCDGQGSVAFYRWVLDRFAP
jgi:DnaJ-class molecular chaperone